MEIQWPLVLFSLTAGTGGSLFAFVGLSEFLGGYAKMRDAGAVCSLALIVIGGCFSVLHLASPLHAISAVTNLLSFSGISIELMLLGACCRTQENGEENPETYSAAETDRIPVACWETADMQMASEIIGDTLYYVKGDWNPEKGWIDNACIYKKELKGYFTGMMGYVFIAFALAVIGIYTVAVNFIQSYPNFEYVLDSIRFLFLLLILMGGRNGFGWA